MSERPTSTTSNDTIVFSSDTELSLIRGSTYVGEGSRTGVPIEQSTPSLQQTVARTKQRSWAIERSMLARLLKAVGHPAIRIVLWDGAEARGQESDNLRTMTILNRRALWNLVRAPDYYMPEGYMRGDIVIDGDLIEFMQEVNRSYRTEWTRGNALRRAWEGRSLLKAKRNISHHYDLGNDFYKLWLDEQLVYTCAYFESPEASLEAAQVAKMDHVCRKLQLQPGEHVIEAGCGWGALALHMAKHYGVHVRAFNVSKEQVRYARERTQQEGFAGQVEFIEDDWRNITGKCDAFVSVGMLEHVGPENCQRLGDVIHTSLEQHGRGLIHTIGMNYNQQFNRWIEDRIFPGAQPPSLRQMLDVFEPHDFSVIDVENLRPHYALTLRHWLERFERSLPKVREMYDEQFIRMWRMYLGASASAFETGGLQLFQVVFLPASRPDYPWTREHLYWTAQRATRLSPK